MENERLYLRKELYILRYFSPHSRIDDFLYLYKIIFFFKKIINTYVHSRQFYLLLCKYLAPCARKATFLQNPFVLALDAEKHERHIGVGSARPRHEKYSLVVVAVGTLGLVCALQGWVLNNFTVEKIQLHSARNGKSERVHLKK